MKNCLIVDDSRVIRAVARRILAGLGFQTSEAGDGKAALDGCMERMPDVVLVDWNMPVMNGIDFVRSLRRLPKGGDPKVVVCTTENDVDCVRQAMEAGADEYIMKPFDSDIVGSKLELIGAL